MRYPNVAGTEIRSRMKLRSTVPGANNRLDVENILSFDRADGSATSMMSALSELALLCTLHVLMISKNPQSVRF